MVYNIDNNRFVNGGSRSNNKMVDFDNPETITNTPEDLVKKIILESLIFVEDAIEEYNKKEFKGFQTSNYLIRARLYTLFSKLAPAIRQDQGEKIFKELAEKVKSTKTTDLIISYNFINSWLYKKELTNVFKKSVIL